MFFAKIDLLLKRAIWQCSWHELLAALVPAKVDGVLCDVRIAGPTNGNLGLIANHAGCALVESDDETDRLRLSVEAARGPRIFLLRCGQAPEPGFIEEANDFLAQMLAGNLPAADLRAAPESILERLFPFLAPVAGIIASRERLLSAPRGGFQQLTRRIGAVTTLRTRARRIG